MPTTRTTERTADRETEPARTCPECDGQIVRDGDGRHCADCGLVLEETQIDRGPEWRAFDASERDRKSRVGAPTTEQLHDRGLSTNISWQNKDAAGNALSSRQREKMQRLRTWNERFRTTSSKDRNLKHALGARLGVASALGIPEDVRESASVVYRRALAEDLLPGRSIEGMAAAALNVAIRQASIPRSIDELATVSRVPHLEIARTYRYLADELSLPMAPPDPLEYVPRYASMLDIDSETERRAHELLANAIEEGLHAGKHPVGLAAAALYAAGRLTDATLTQDEVSAVADVSNVTIRNRYQELLELELT